MSVIRNDVSPTIEEVLASIRRVMRDTEPLQNDPAQLLQDPSDEHFELPALFRNSARREVRIHHIVDRAAWKDDLSIRPDHEPTHREAEMPVAARQPDQIVTPLVSSAPGSQAKLPRVASELPRTMRSCKDIHVSRMSEVIYTTPASIAQAQPEQRHRLPRYSTQIATVATASEAIAAGNPLVPADQVDELIGSMVADHFHKTAVEILRPIVEEWFAANAQTILEDAIRNDAET